MRLHIGYIQKGVLGGTSCFEALINRCSKEVSNEDYYSAQEIMHHLLPLKLTSRSFNVVPINLNGPRRVKLTEQMQILQLMTLFLALIQNAKNMSLTLWK